MPQSPRRLSPADRRRHLLEVGLELLAENSYEDVWIDEVARKAGVSRSLLYHYFASKQAFVAAILEREGDRLADATIPDPTLSPPGQVACSVDAFFDYVESHPDGWRALFRWVSSDAAVRGIVERNLGLQASRILYSVCPDGDPDPLLVAAVHGWLAFLVEATVRWLDHPEMPRSALRDLSVQMLATAVNGAGVAARSAR